MDWKYITRNNTAPFSKCKIYYSSHKDDFDSLCFSISQDILKIKDCAIFYAPNDDIVDEEYYQNLKQMQLFVFSVTSKLLQDNNRAINVDLQFAIANNIPVLPIIEEEGVEGIYEKFFNKIHYLVRNISGLVNPEYFNQLRKAIDAIIADDDVFSKIHSEVKGHIFISYRKKDKGILNRFVADLRRLEFLQDVSIWYDSFLVASENYEDRIVEAINKCDLFLVLGTKGLFEKPNYVVDNEIPLAEKLNKRIIIVDYKDDQKHNYSEISNRIEAIVSFEDYEKIETVLNGIFSYKYEDYVHNIHRHNYLIGLGYMYGVDFDIDYFRAVELIKSSAANGCLEAMKKLSEVLYKHSLYETDIEEAICWQKKYVNYLFDTFCANESKEEYLIKYIAEELVLAEYECKSDRLKEARNTCWRVLNNCKRDGRYGPLFFDSLDIYYRRAYLILGEVFGKRNDKKQSIECYIKAAIELDKYLDQYACDREALLFVAQMCINVSNIITKSKEFVYNDTYLVWLCGKYNMPITEISTYCLNNSIKLLETLCNLDCSEDNIKLLAVAYLINARSLFEDYYLDDKLSEIMCDKAIDLLEESILRNGYESCVEEYIESLVLRGDIYLHKENFDLSSEFYEKVLKQTDCIEENRRSARIWDSVCYCNIQRAKIYKKNNCEQKCLEICETLIDRGHKLYNLTQEKKFLAYSVRAGVIHSDFSRKYTKKTFNTAKKLFNFSQEYAELFFAIKRSFYQRHLIDKTDFTFSRLEAYSSLGNWFLLEMDGVVFRLNISFVSCYTSKQVLEVELSDFLLREIHRYQEKNKWYYLQLGPIGMESSRPNPTPDEFVTVFFYDGTHQTYQICYG